MFVSKKVKATVITVLLSLLLAQPAFAGSYTVTSGDSLYTIGKLFNTSANVLIKSNTLPGNLIKPGLIFNVPCDVYTVKSGDSLYSIAKKFDVTIGSLRKANNEWDDVIYPGQKLNLPGNVSASSTTTNASAISPVN